MGQTKPPKLVKRNYFEKVQNSENSSVLFEIFFSVLVCKTGFFSLSISSFLTVLFPHWFTNSIKRFERGQTNTAFFLLFLLFNAVKGTFKSGSINGDELDAILPTHYIFQK